MMKSYIMRASLLAITLILVTVSSFGANDLFADGGISFKSLIQESDVVPNVSELLENQCECKKFDFKNIVV